MNDMVTWYVYLVKCNDKKETLYCGITKNLEKRIKQHNNNKGAKYIKGKTPVILIRSFEVANKSEALKIEFYIKSLSKSKKLKFSLDDYKNL